MGPDCGQGGPDRLKLEDVRAGAVGSGQRHVVVQARAGVMADRLRHPRCEAWGGQPAGWAVDDVEICGSGWGGRGVTSVAFGHL